MFEGEPDHLVPAASEVLIESDLFRVAGRMLAHSFLHDGPQISGISPAIVHVLLNGEPETATVVVEDCPDLHFRAIIELVWNIKNNLRYRKGFIKLKYFYGPDFRWNRKNLCGTEGQSF